MFWVRVRVRVKVRVRARVSVTVNAHNALGHSRDAIHHRLYRQALQTGSIDRLYRQAL